MKNSNNILRRTGRFLLTNKIKFGVGFVVACITVVVGVVFVPSLYSKSYIEGQYMGIDNSRTEVQGNSWWGNLWNPEYIIYNTTENNEARVNYVTLRRKYLFLWDIKDQAFYSLESDTPEAAEQNLDVLAEQVANGELPAEPQMPDTSDTNAEALEQYNSQYSEGSVYQSYSDPKDIYKVEVHYGQTPDYNYVTINGEKKSSLVNVANVQLDISGEYVYFSGYTLKEVPGYTLVYSTGKIYRYKLDSGIEQEVYDFGDTDSFVFKANDEIIIYSNENDELGKIDIATKQVVKFDMTKWPKEIKRSEFAVGGTVPIIVQPYAIGPKTVIIVHYDPPTEAGQTESYYRLDLDSFSIIE